MTAIEENGHVHSLREISCNDSESMNTVADLHIELLGFGPMAALGRRFIRDACYANNMMGGQLNVALYEIDGEPAGFVAYTDRSISFHRTSLKAHWFRTGVTLLISLLQDPRRIVALFKALSVLSSRRAETGVLGSDPMGEVVCVAVRPQFLRNEYLLADGSRPSVALIAYAARQLASVGVEEMRMLVDADNKAVLFLYKALGANFEPYEQAGVPTVQVWFDVSKLVEERKCRWAS